MSQEWMLSVPYTEKDALYGLRHLSHLKMGTADDQFWVTGFTDDQLADQAVLRMRQKQVYAVKGGKLYLKGSLLPARSMPFVLWTPIDRALPVKLPNYRGNYTDLPPPAVCQLVPVATEQEPKAQLVDLNQLAHYIKTAPAVRLKPISWVMLGQHDALLFGLPLLPIPGKTFWARARILLPAGYDLNFPLLANWLNLALNPSGREWVLLTADNEQIPIPATHWQPLTRQTVDDTLKAFTHAV